MVQNNLTCFFLNSKFVHFSENEKYMEILPEFTYKDFTKLLRAKWTRDELTSKVIPQYEIQTAVSNVIEYISKKMPNKEKINCLKKSRTISVLQRTQSNQS